MLSIAPITPGHAAYYLEIASTDYYFSGGEPEGVWIGGGAGKLGLQNGIGKGRDPAQDNVNIKIKVDQQTLGNLLDGFSAHSRDVKLVQNAGLGPVSYVDARGETKTRERQQGWDLTFSAPKDVDVLWAVAPPEERRILQECHFAAVNRAFGYLEAEAAVCRRGKGGADQEPVRLVAAAFEHGTSRANDPKLHTHVVVANVGVRADGTTGTVESLPLYRHQRAAGALYRAELAHQLEARLGILVHRATETVEVLGRAVTVPKSWFEIDGVPKDLREAWSQRRQDVLAYMAKYGGTDSADAEIAVINSRGAKDIRPRGELLGEWQEFAAQNHGFTPESVLQLTSKAHVVARERDPETVRAEAVRTALETITESESVFTRRELIQHVAEAAQGQGMGADDVIQAVEAALKAAPEIVRLTGQEPDQSQDQGKQSDNDNDAAFTTAEMLQRETELYRDAEALGGRCHVRATDAALDATYAARGTLTPEQKLALLKATRGPADLQMIAGDPGTGKTYFLGALRETFERDGISVVGACVAGKAARGLEEESGIKSQTVYKLLRALENEQQSDGECSTVLPHRGVLVIDEAGMLGTKATAALLEAAKERECRVVLVGDAKQLQAVDAGGPFRSLVGRFGGASLTDIIRQRDEETGDLSPWKIEAIRQIGRGEGSEALKTYAEKGLLRVAEDKIGAMSELVEGWKEHAHEPEKALVFAATRSDVDRLNRLCRAERMAQGLVCRNRSVTLDSGVTLHQGDRVLLTRNAARLGVSNGDLGTIERIRGEALTVRLDRGESVVIHAEKYAHMELGYAMTTHKAQGVTVDRAFVLAGGSMQDRELTYVQASRARYEVRLFTSKLDAAGDGIATDLDRLGRQVERSRPKVMASDVQRAGEHKTRGRREAATSANAGLELTLAI